MHEKITVQGNKVRDVKAAKAEKSIIDGEVKILLALKAEYKAAAGKDWKPEAAVKTPASDSGKVTDTTLSKKVQEQGEKVRKLKAEKAEKKVIDQEVKELLNLKAEYKKITGKDWAPAEVIGQSSKSCETDGAALSIKVAKQGDKVRQLKAEKADKKTIDVEVKNLLALKTEYKNATGKDWKPEAATPVSTSVVQAPEASNEQLSNKIQQQGDKVRELKTAKAEKKLVEQEVKVLLALKAEYKKAVGEDWKPKETTVAPPKMSTESADSIATKIAEQGDKVRQLKTAKAEKSKIDDEVKILLKLKNDYKSVTGKEWKPSATSVAATPSTNQPAKDNELSNEITKAGDHVRRLKSEKAEKNAIDEAVKILLDLKSSYKAATGQDWKPPGGGEKPGARNAKESSKPAEKGAKKGKAKEQQGPSKEAETNKTGTRLGLEAKKTDNLSDWYSQVITKGEMIEYYDVSGCYVLRPWSFSIWDIIKDYIDREIKKMGVQNCYFPIFVTKAVLEREKDHIADFAPEVAWVTRSGDSELAEPIAIRPTSETVMYPAYAKWLKSHRDLPLKLNQWNNVVVSISRTLNFYQPNFFTAKFQNIFHKFQ